MRSKRRSLRRSTKNNVVDDQEGGAGFFRGLNLFSKKEQPVDVESSVPSQRKRRPAAGPRDFPSPLRRETDEEARLGEEGVEGISPEGLLERVKNMEEKIRELEVNCANTGDIDDYDSSELTSSESKSSESSGYSLEQNVLGELENDDQAVRAKLSEKHGRASNKLKATIEAKKQARAARAAVKVDDPRAADGVGEEDEDEDEEDEDEDEEDEDEDEEDGVAARVATEQKEQAEAARAEAERVAVKAETARVAEDGPDDVAAEDANLASARKPHSL
jgi:hypothetical protein